MSDDERPNKPDKPTKRAGMYIAMDVHEDAEGLYYTEYSQWDTSTAIKVYPMNAAIDEETGLKVWRPETHGGPLLSLMARDGAREKIPQALRFLIGELSFI